MQEILLHGSGEEEIPFLFEGASQRNEIVRPYEGILPNLDRRYRETSSDRVRRDTGRYMTGPGLSGL